MSDWNYSFDTISKSAWIKQMERELRSGGIDSLQDEWWPGEDILPALHSDDKIPLIKLPDQLFSQPPAVMEWVDTDRQDAKSTNQKILEALRYGVQSLVLQVDTDHKMPIRLWLDGVFTDMIELSVSLSKETPEIIHGVKEIIPQGALIRLNRNFIDQSASVFFEALQGSKDENANAYRFIYEFCADGDWTLNASKRFQHILGDLSYWTSQGFNPVDYLENCILVFKPDTLYLKQIIQTRVLHLVWKNIWDIYTNNLGGPSVSYLECHITPGLIQDPDIYLVRASTSALAASMTGVHVLCIHHLAQTQVADFYSRSDRNIQHLLNLESEMYNGADPLGGSYMVDYYTHRWTKDIWSRLIF